MADKWYSFSTPNEADFQKFAAGQDQAVFYKPRQVFRLYRWLHYAALAGILLSVLRVIQELGNSQAVFTAYFGQNPAASQLGWAVTIGVALFVIVINSAIIYLPLKAFGSLLLILMEMEFNSRA